jgi:hypothetical protein
MDVQIQVFLSLALAGGKWSASRSGRFTPHERVLIHTEEGAEWDTVERTKFFNLPELELRPISGPAHNQLLYHLRYLSSYIFEFGL